MRIVALIVAASVAAWLARPRPPARRPRPFATPEGREFRRLMES